MPNVKEEAKIEKAEAKAEAAAVEEAAGDAEVVAAFASAVQMASRYENPEEPLREFLKLVGVIK